MLLKGLLFCIILFCSICYIINVDAGIVFFGGWRKGYLLSFDKVKYLFLSLSCFVLALQGGVFVVIVNESLLHDAEHTLFEQVTNWVFLFYF